MAGRPADAGVRHRAARDAAIARHTTPDVAAPKDASEPRLAWLTSRSAKAKAPRTLRSAATSPCITPDGRPTERCSTPRSIRDSRSVSVLGT
jgi:hypothetical protein